MKKYVMMVGFVCLSYFGAFAQVWMTNLEQAENKAASEQKKVLLVFSGSDWCIPCMKLERFILESDDFKTFSNDHYILVRADFPKQKKHQLTPEQEGYNEQLAAKYNPDGFFPLVVLLTAKGDVLGTTGFKNVSPADYIHELVTLE